MTHAESSRRRHNRLVVLGAVLTLVLVATSCRPQGNRVAFRNLPPDAVGHSERRIVNVTHGPAYHDGTGAFRINCSLSHMNYDDPIVAPRKKRATHLHAYFGNTDVDFRSDAASIAGSGNSTCTGGTVNRSAYWAPAVIDMATNLAVMPWGENGLQVYYKSGYRGVPSTEIQNMPAGLRMIAGNARATSPQTTGHVTYSCEGQRPVGPQYTFPNCQPGDRLLMAVEFPQCWDGVNLDSADHQSHMAYGTWARVPGSPGSGCPSSHPVPIPSITQNFRYEVPAGGMSTWRLSSDVYEGPAGYTGHADWWNGWDASVFQKVIDNCYAHSLDCQMNLLGDGTALY